MISYDERDMDNWENYRYRKWSAMAKLLNLLENIKVLSPDKGNLTVDDMDSFIDRHWTH